MRLLNVFFSLIAAVGGVSNDENGVLGDELGDMSFCGLSDVFVKLFDKKKVKFSSRDWIVSNCLFSVELIMDDGSKSVF